MKILILTPYYPPEMGAPPTRLYEIAVRLQKMGHGVTVITAFPNRPLGKIYDGYGGKFQDCHIEDGVWVIRTWVKPSAASASFMSRTINDLSFTWSSGWTTAKLLSKQDILIVQNPPLFSVFSAYHLAKKVGAKLVMWCGDIWPDVLIESGQLEEGLMARLMRWVQQYGFYRSHLLAVTNPTIAEKVQTKYNCPAVTVWSNGVDTALFTPELRNQKIRAGFGADDETLLVGYSGLHGRFQGLDTIVESATILSSKNIKFVFIGDGVEKPALKAQAERLGLQNLRFYDPLPKVEMPAFVANCDVSVIALITRMPGTMPSKFYEAIAAGTIPVVADGCEAAPLVQKYKAGAIYEPGNAQSVADALMSIKNMSEEKRQQMRSNARDLSLRFDRDRLAEFIHHSLKSLSKNEELPFFDW